MAMVLQANRMTSRDSSNNPVESYQSLHRKNSSLSSTPPRSASPSSNHDDTFRRMIFDKVEEGKQDLDPHNCRRILEDLMTMLKHLTADVNKYNLAFRESRPAFYMREFERLTDRIDILTKARDALTEHLREVSDQSSDLNAILPSPTGSESSSPSYTQTQHSPLDKISRQQRLSLTSPPLNIKELSGNEFSYNRNDTSIQQSSFPLTSTVSSHSITRCSSTLSSKSRSSSLAPNYFIRVHFPNKHTTALVPRNDETLEVALESRASRHSVTNLRAYTPVYMISRQPCPWNIPLDRLLESEIELEEKTKLDHCFIRKTFFTLTYCDTCHKLVFQGLRCLVCGYRIHTRCIHKFRSCRFEPQDIFSRHIKHLGVNRHGTSNKNKEQSKSLPRNSQPKLNGFLNNLNSNPGIPVINPESLQSNPTKSSQEAFFDTKKTIHKHISDWEIRPEDLLNRGRMVGRGIHGTVYQAEVRLHGQVALKELNFLSPTESQFQAFRNEVLALKKITHQNTLNFYGYILSPRFAIVTQWCDGSTLYKHIHVLDRHWKINQLIDVARQICQGMSYLHDRGIIHRDLKSSNVFLDVGADTDDSGVCWRVKIGDFGLAAVTTALTEDANKPSQPSGSILWMSPEVIQQKDPNCYSTKADVYSYGCVLFEMFSGKLPHTPINNKEQIMWLVGKGRLKLKVEQCRDDTPSAIIDLICRCTEYDYEKRPDFAPEIDDTLSKFDFILPRLQRSQSEPCLIRTHQDDLLVLSNHFGIPKTPISIHRRFNAEMS